MTTTFFRFGDYNFIKKEQPEVVDWTMELFLNSWKKTIVEESSYWNENDIEKAGKIVIKSLYETYEACLVIINEQKISESQKNDMAKKLKLAMNCLLRYGIDHKIGIIKMLTTMKIRDNSKISFSTTFNEIIDLLIQGLDEADNKLIAELKK